MYLEAEYYRSPHRGFLFSSRSMSSLAESVTGFSDIIGALDFTSAGEVG